MSATNQNPSHLIAVLQAIFVTFLWSTSWVLIKWGLQDIPALTFAGLRYGLAFACLLPFALQGDQRQALRSLELPDWGRLALLGLLFIAVTQGAQFLGLAYLPAMTVSLLLNFTALIVALLGLIFLAEYPSRVQWIGVFLFILGLLAYFYPVQIPAGEIFGLTVVMIGVLANAFSSILGRAINRNAWPPPLTVTIISIGVGAAVLLVSGIAIYGWPQLSLRHWSIILWLAAVNTAFAFPLWNRTLRTLSAMESTIINSTMLIQIAILAWVFLGERISYQQSIGLLISALGVVLVQLRPGNHPSA